MRRISRGSESFADQVRLLITLVTPIRTASLTYFPSLESSYESPTWIPFLEFEFQELASKACCLHLKSSLVDLSNDLDLYIIKMNSYVSVEYRQLGESMRHLLPTPEGLAVERREDEALELVIQNELE